MLAAIIPKMYIDLDWVSKEYLRRWKKENTDEALQCFNLERIIDAELRGEEAPIEMTLDELLAEGEEKVLSGKDGNVTVVDR